VLPVELTQVTKNKNKKKQRPLMARGMNAVKLPHERGRHGRRIHEADDVRPLTCAPLARALTSLYVLVYVAVVLAALRLA
jgi:hypothetical protein